MKSSSNRTISSRQRYCITQNLLKIVVVLVVVGWLLWYWNKLPYMQVDGTHRVRKAGATLHQHQHQAADTQHAVDPALNNSKGFDEEVRRDGESDKEKDEADEHKGNDHDEDYAELKKEKMAASKNGDGGDDDGKESDGTGTKTHGELEKDADRKDGKDGDDDHDADKHADGDYYDYNNRKNGSKKTVSGQIKEGGNEEAGEHVVKDLTEKKHIGNEKEDENAVDKSGEKETEKADEKPRKTPVETGIEQKDSAKEIEEPDKAAEQAETKQGAADAGIKQTGSGNSKLLVKDTESEPKEIEKEMDERDRAPSGRMGVKEVVPAADSQQTGSGNRTDANADDAKPSAVISGKSKRSEGSAVDDIGDSRGDRLSPVSGEAVNPPMRMREQSTDERYITMTRNMTDSRGLGNQIFDLAALVYAAELSDRIPALVDYNVGLLLEKSFDLNIRRIDDTPLLQSSPKFEETASNGLRFSPDLEYFAKRVKSPNAGRLALIDGHFQSWKYAAKVENNLRQRYLVIPPQSKESAKKFFDDNTPSSWKNEKIVHVGIHVRRGVILLQYNVELGYENPDAEYFQQAMTYFTERFGRVQFVVVSNEISWCRQHIVLSPEVGDAKASLAFSDGSSAVLDIALLASCDHVIMSVGAFGWWGGWLANGTTIYYSKFPRPGSPLASKFSREDFFHPRWIGMP